ncbi:MAG: Gfo/Idh/MocA family oxidoreductase [Clostridia bacterium]|nr:Gfo/Idh/MocA family oxidoreductase [Clostridia bacterium]
MSNKFKVGIIGCGGISHSHLHGYRALSDRVEITACCDIDEEKAKEYAKRNGIARAYGSCEEMLANEKLDLCSVTTWNSAHVSCAVAALEAGCHVLCEKPLSLNADEALRMQSAARKAGKLLMPGFVRRHGNDAAAAIDLIEKGYLGEIYFAKATYLRRNGFPGGWFGDKSRSGGGPLIDLGVHIIDLTRYIMGNPKPVSVYGATFDKLGARENIRTDGWVSETKTDRPIFDVEDLAVAMIRFDNGALLSVETSFNLNLKHGANDIELFGTKAGLTLSPFELHGELNNRLADIALAGDNDFHFERDFDREMKNFVDAADGKASPLATAEDGVQLMRILDAVYRSAETGETVFL